MSEHPEQQYLQLLRYLIDSGDERIDRTGVGTRARFGHEMRFNLEDGFPLFTTKRVYWKTAFKEMLWMLSGGDNIRQLLEQNVRIWTDWPLKHYRKETNEDLSQEEFEARILGDDNFARQWGKLGPVYGKQWRRWSTADGGEIDQVQKVLDDLKSNPTSRRILWDGWNVAELDDMALPPCHKHYQFYVNQSEGKLCGAMVQRSADAFLGLAWNIANLALVTHLIAKQTGYQPGEIVWFGMDVHLYLNHIEQAKTQISREPYALPTLEVDPAVESLFDYTIDHLNVVNYRSHAAIAGDVAV
ncbi:thymidylate synthase [Chromatiales bacterium (ex Bugula neritina AB1)]|nr:thymidylate synthase [Chromatiales bacterium (ex Bugula neritina AB1)]